MKATVILKKLLTGACFWYTAASVIILTAAMLITGDTSGSVAAVSHLLLFPFGLALSGAGMVFRCSGLPRWARLLLHFFITLAAFFCFLWLPSGVNINATSVFTALLLLSLAYWLICLIVILTRKRFRSFKEE